MKIQQWYFLKSLLLSENISVSFLYSAPLKSFGLSILHFECVFSPEMMFDLTDPLKKCWGLPEVPKPPLTATTVERRGLFKFRINQ